MPKVELSELRLAKSLITDRIYVGKMNKKCDEWISKVDVSNDFLTVVLSRWLGYEEIITRQDGKKFKISVEEIK